MLSVWRKKRVYVQRKNGQSTQGEYKAVASICREKIRKAKAQHELNLAMILKVFSNLNDSMIL